MCLWAEILAFDQGPLFSYGTAATNQEFSLRTKANSGTFQVQFWVNDHAVTIAQSTSGWHHYCLTYDGSAFVLYFDGTERLTDDEALNTGTTYEFCLGCRYHSSGWGFTYFDGALDELYVYSSALDADAVHALYLRGTTALPTSVPSASPSSDSSIAGTTT